MALDRMAAQQVSAAPDWSISAFPRIAEMFRSFIFARCGAHNRSALLLKLLQRTEHMTRARV